MLGSVESFVYLVDFLNVIVGNHPFQIPQPRHQVAEILVVLVVVGVQVQGTAVLIIRRIQVHERLQLRQSADILLDEGKHPIKDVYLGC